MTCSMVCCKVRYLFTSNQINQTKIKTYSNTIYLITSIFQMSAHPKNQHLFQNAYYEILNNHSIFLTSISKLSGFIARLRIFER